MPIVGRAELTPYPEDAAIIEEYRKEAGTNTGGTNATDLRSFSDYLRQSNKKGIAGRLSGNALDGDVKGYKQDAGGHRNIGAALAHLRQSHAGAKELERRVSPVPDRDDAALMEPRRVGDAAAQHSAWQEAGSWPKELPAESHDRLIDESGPSSSAPQPAQSTRFLKRVSKRPLHFRDQDFIFSLEEALVKGGAAEQTAKNNVSILLGFGHWLFANNKDPVKDRLDKQSLTDDAREFIGKGDPSRLLTAISHLRTSQSTGEPCRSQAALS
ncbi:hypothetical protein [Mesorhizobium huakuii]|uniref:hypothetical protein n=1 Tax=Mesorhizobium huakuii TaxID=28104 RepID=UPI0032B0026A